MSCSALRRHFLFIVLVLSCFAFLPKAQAVNPSPDGGYANFNTAEGTDALFSLTRGLRNTAIGFHALYLNTIGSNNTANGTNALRNNTGTHNTANGSFALYSNTIAWENTANGSLALYSNTTGAGNTANGSSSLYRNTNGDGNTANGTFALFYTTGNYNTALGYAAGDDLTAGSGNVCIGADVHGVAGESDTTRIRNVYASVATARAIYVNSDDKLGTLASSRRYKEDIKPMDKASEVIFALRPVSFRYKKEVDAARALSFGLIAEEVAEISPELVTCDREGQTRNCPLRGGECDAAQRVPGRASHSAGIKIRRGEKRSDNFAAQINGGKAASDHHRVKINCRATREGDEGLRHEPERAGGANSECKRAT